MHTDAGVHGGPVLFSLEFNLLQLNTTQYNAKRQHIMQQVGVGELIRKSIRCALQRKLVGNGEAGHPSLQVVISANRHLIPHTALVNIVVDKQRVGGKRDVDTRCSENQPDRRLPLLPEVFCKVVKTFSPRRSEIVCSKIPSEELSNITHVSLACSDIRMCRPDLFSPSTKLDTSSIPCCCLIRFAGIAITLREIVENPVFRFFAIFQRLLENLDIAFELLHSVRAVSVILEERLLHRDAAAGAGVEKLVGGRQIDRVRMPG